MTDPIIVDSKYDSIKLIKNTKGYQWEIKVADLELSEKTMERLNKYETEIQKKYGHEGDKELKGGTEENNG